MERNRRGNQLAVAAIVLALLLCAVAAAGRSSDEGFEADAPAAMPGVGGEQGASRIRRVEDTAYVHENLQDAASEQLCTYRDMRSCTLACSGYLDLYGNAWGCIVQGDGWTEIAVIKAIDEGTCSIQTIRLDIR